MSNKIFLIVFSFFHLTSFSQKKLTVTSIFDKVEKYYVSKNNFCLSSKYTFFENKSINKILDSYEGLIVKKGAISYQKVNNTEFVNFGDCSLMISKDNKVVNYANMASSAGQPIALKSFLKILPLTKITDQNEYWVCELSSKGKIPLQFKKIIVYINKKNFSLSKQIFYSVGKQEIIKNNNKQTISNPRIEILFFDKIFTSEMNLLIDKKNYFRKVNKKINLVKRLQSYKLITL